VELCCGARPVAANTLAEAIPTGELPDGELPYGESPFRTQPDLAVMAAGHATSSHSILVANVSCGMET